MNKMIFLLTTLLLGTLLNAKTWDPALPMNTNGNGDWRSDSIFVYLPNGKDDTKANRLGIASCFYENYLVNHQPIAKKTQSDFQPENGWVLLYENLGRPGDSRVSPCFMLYNRHTGLLRTFLYKYKYLTDLSTIVSTLSASHNSYSLSLGEGANYLYAADKKNLFERPNNQSTLSFPMLPNGTGYQWIWSEFPILYDPNQSTLSSWSLRVAGILSGTIDLQSNFAANIGTATTGQKKDNIGTIFKAGAKTIGCFKEGLDWKNKTLEFLNDPKTPFYDWLNKEGIGKSLSGFTGQIASVLPYANALYGMFSFFTGGGGNGNSTESVVASMLSNLSLSGDIQFSTTVSDNIGFPEPSNSSPSDPYLRYYKPLGTFNLKTSPTVEFRNCWYDNGCVSSNHNSEYYYICKRLKSRSFKVKTAPQFVINPASGLNQTLSIIEGAVQYKIRWNDVYSCDGTWNGPPHSPNNPAAYWAPGTMNMMRTVAVPQWAAENNFKIIADCNNFTIVQSDFLPWSKLENTVFDIPVAWGYDVVLKVKAAMSVAGKPSYEPVVFVGDYKMTEVCVAGTEYFNSSSNLTSLPVMGRIDAIGDNCPLVKVRFVEISGGAQTNNVYEVYADNKGLYSCSLPRNKFYRVFYNIAGSKDDEKDACNDISVAAQYLNSKGVIEIKPVTLHIFNKQYNWVSFPAILHWQEYDEDEDGISYDCELLTYMKPMIPRPWGLNQHFAVFSQYGQELRTLGQDAVANLHSKRGYKVYTNPVRTRTVFTTGDYLSTKKKVKLYAGKPNWIGYWIPGSQVDLQQKSVQFLSG